MSDAIAPLPLTPTATAWAVPGWVPWLIVAAVGFAAVARYAPWYRPRRAWSSVLPGAGRPTPLALELLVADRGRRRALEGELRNALARLQRLLGPALPAHTSVVVLETIGQEAGLAGCAHVGERPGGAPYAILLLAVRVGDEDLSTGRVMAVLAEQCLALAARRDAGTTLVFPFTLPAAAARPEHATGQMLAVPPGGTARPDPLAAPPPLSPLSPLGAHHSLDGHAAPRRAG